MARYIDADAVEQDLRKQYKEIFEKTRKEVRPEDFFIERNHAYFVSVFAEDMEALFKYLNAKTIADVQEVKHEKWIKHKPNKQQMKEFHKLGIGRGMSENSVFWTCSCCGSWGTLAYKYCPHCGAKMDGGKAE